MVNCILQDVPRDMPWWQTTLNAVAAVQMTVLTLALAAWILLWAAGYHVIPWITLELRMR